jgi:anti-sigma regulatory factor (Ser/Thr protein kinase)
MATKITLPANFSITAVDRFTREIVGPAGPLDDAFRFDFSALNFIDGTGYTVLSNTLEWLRDQGVRCSFCKFEKTERPAISYLDDCGFFQRYVKFKLRPEAKSRSTTLPCMPVAHASAHGWLEFTLSPWARGVLLVSHEALTSVRGAVKEVFHNINDHSTLHTGFVHAQHYPNNHTLKITLSDFGRGIPSTICERFGEMTDGEAILYASQEGVTAKSRPNNMGLGINYLIDRVTANDGSVQIRSLRGNLYCYRDRKAGQVRTQSTRNGIYPGTLIDITLDTRLFIGDEEGTRNLEW